MRKAGLILFIGGVALLIIMVFFSLGYVVLHDVLPIQFPAVLYRLLTGCVAVIFTGAVFGIIGFHKEIWADIKKMYNS
jgi:hypothetical protein